MVLNIRCLSRVYSILNIYIYVLMAIYNIYNNLIYLPEYSFRLLRWNLKLNSLSLLLDEIAIKSQQVCDGNLNKFTGCVYIGVDSC